MLHVGRRWKEQGARFVSSQRQRYKLRCTRYDAESGGVGILVKEEVSGNIVTIKSIKTE